MSAAFWTACAVALLIAAIVDSSSFDAMMGYIAVATASIHRRFDRLDRG